MSPTRCNNGGGLVAGMVISTNANNEFRACLEIYIRGTKCQGELDRAVRAAAGIGVLLTFDQPSNMTGNHGPLYSTAQYTMVTRNGSVTIVV